MDSVPPRNGIADPPSSDEEEEEDEEEIVAVRPVTGSKPTCVSPRS